MIEQLLTPADVAEILQVPVKTLYQWRHRGVGPPALKIGRHLRYRPTDIGAFLAERAPPSSSTAGSEHVRTFPDTPMEAAYWSGGRDGPYRPRPRVKGES